MKDPISTPPGFGPIGFGEVPAGALMAFAGKLGRPNPNTANPATVGETGDHVTDPLEAWGWMLCDGRSLKICEYPELFAALGILYGGTDDCFCIPDYRGYFWRGTDAGAGVDKDAATMRTCPAGGTTTNSGVGSIQKFAVQTHEHAYLHAATTAAPATSGSTAGAPLAQTKLTQGGPTSSLSAPGDVEVSPNETRPSNISVNYIIKFSCGVRPVTW